MIHGLTDQINLRRDGKIRGGTRDKTTKKMGNTPYFLLHDAKQLIPVLGENPTEIYFAAFCDDVEAIAKTSLRSYSGRILNCLGNGKTAGYYQKGDVPGVTNRPHPILKGSRLRTCQYKQCPDFVEDRCGEHLFLEMIIPQYSMASSFTLDNSSVNGILNVLSTLNKAKIRYAGQISGQIFRLYKRPMDMNYEIKGELKKSPRPVVHLDHVPFETYERLFRDKIKDEDWRSLVALQDRTLVLSTTQSEPEDAESESTETAETATFRPQLADQTQSDNAALKERANHPVVVALFDELAALRGRENTEEARINTAKKTSSVGELVEWLKKVIAADKRKKEAEQPAVSSTAATTTTAEVIQTAAGVIAAIEGQQTGSTNTKDQSASGLF